jgi:hypothetical protein
MPDVHREAWQVARKTHTCCECNERIKAGDSYEYVFIVYDSDTSSFHTCEKCADLRDSMTAMGFCGNYGELWQDHREYVNEYQPQRVGQNND